MSNTSPPWGYKYPRIHRASDRVFVVVFASHCRWVRGSFINRGRPVLSSMDPPDPSGRCIARERTVKTSGTGSGVGIGSAPGPHFGGGDDGE